MIQTVATMISMLLSAGAAGVIGTSILAEHQALRRALAGAEMGGRPSLPPRTHRVVSPRRARFIRIRLVGEPTRAVA